MEIQEITRWRFDGKEYNTVDAIKTEIENRIGKIIDYSDVTLNPKQRLNIHKAICENKTELRKLLSVTFDQNPNEGGKEINILDYK